MHPRIVEELIQQQAPAKSDDRGFVSLVNAVLPVLSELSQETALSICRTVSRTIPLSNLNLQPVVQRYPRQVADLILSSNDTAKVSFDKVAHKLESQQLISLINTRKETIDELHILHLLAPQERGILYNQLATSWRTQGYLTAGIISYLPRDIRELEARYNLNLPALTTVPYYRLPYASFLPWSDARAFLNRYINNPDFELR